MADPINYCSWFYSSFCITQSEWATWTQAGLTFATFAIALARQEYVSSRAARDKAEAEAKLAAEREAHSEAQKATAAQAFALARRAENLRARAVAISIKPQLIQFESALLGLSEGELLNNPGAAFAFFSKYLDLRNRAIDALDLLHASNAVLTAVHYANTIHSYLDSRKTFKVFEGDDAVFLKTFALENTQAIKLAQEVVDSLIFRKTTQTATNHAAS